MKTIRELAPVLVKEHAQSVRTLGVMRHSVRALLEGILLEARFQTRKEVLTSRKDDPETIKLVNLVQKSLDDTFKSKSSKYFSIVFDYIDKNSDKNVQELLDDAIVTLMEFDKIQGVDLNKFASFEELESFVQDAFLSKNKKSEKKPETSSDTISAGDSTLLFEDNDVILYKINSSLGANALAGNDTTWCIARKTSTYFNQYTSTNQIFYFVIDKNLSANDRLQKVAIRVTKNIDNNTIQNINYTSKKNDGDTRNPNELPYYGKLKTIIERDAAAQSPTLLTKIRSGKASKLEIEELWDNYKSSSLSEKIQLNRFVNGVYDNKITEIENREFDSIPDDWKNLDAALIEKLIIKFHNDVFYKKVIGLHNPFLDKKVVQNTQNRFILQQIFLSIPENDDLLIGSEIADNVKDPRILLMIINSDKHDHAKQQAMKNPKFPIDGFVIASKDVSELVRASVALNKKTPPEVIGKLSFDKDLFVKKTALGNKNIPVKNLVLHSTDSDESVRISIANNENAPIEVISAFVDDDSENVRIAAFKKTTDTDLLIRLSTDEETKIREAIASNPNTPANVLKLLSVDDEIDVVVAVAANTNTSPDVLTSLADNEEDYVVMGVAGNPNTPQKVLWNFIKNVDQLVAVSFNPNVTYEMLTIIVNSDAEEATYAHYELAHKKDLPKDLLKKLADKVCYCEQCL